MKKSTEERFWSKVDRTGECWLWTGACSPSGYGKFRYGGEAAYSHRLSFKWVHGDIPEGMHIDHRCGTRNCVRPDHLRLVTPAQNGQHRRGVNSNSTTGVRGVYWSEQHRKYHAYAKLSRKKYHVGSFDTLEAAEAAVIAKRRDLYTHDDYAEWAATAEAAPTPGTGGDHVWTR